MNTLSLKHLNWDSSLRMILIMAMLAALVLISLPSYISVTGDGAATSRIGQVAGGTAEANRLALLGENPPLETPMVSWNT